MASPIIIPFDNNPQSTSIKTTAYTIPAGKFARVRNLHGDLTIDTVPHYTILNSFSRTLTTSVNTIDSFYPDLRCDFVKSTRSSTVSNSNNNTRCDFNILSYYLPQFSQVSVITQTANSSYGGLYYADVSFTGTRVSYISALNLQTTVSSTNTATVTAFTTSNGGLFGLCFSTYRVSGTVTHSAISASFDKNEFWVPSGAVLDGVRYMVTEYNNIS